MPFDTAKTQDVLPGSLLAQMDIDVMVNERGDVCALYDCDFPFTVREIAFDRDSGELLFNGDDDLSLPLGLAAPRQTHARLASSESVHLFRVDLGAEHKFQAHDIVPLVQKV